MLTKAEKAKWLADLRGGEYLQCKGFLTNGVGYCCLGVFLNGIKPSGWGKGSCIHLHDNHSTFYHPLFNNDKITNNQTHILSKLNDDGDTFLEIADYIEQYIPTEGE